MINANPDGQTVLNGNQFDGTAPNAGQTDGGRWTFSSVPPGQQAYIKRLHFHGETSVASWQWKLATFDRGTLAYDGQTANFTAGKLLTGATSGATARISKDTDGGATGTLYLTEISGTFQDNEAITDDNGTPGAAVVNGELTPQETLLRPTGTELEYTEIFDEDELPIPNTNLGTPCQVRFYTTNLSGYGDAEVEWGYRYNRK